MAAVRIYFLRHADAGDSNAWKGPDETRPLSELGIERTGREAATLARMGLKPSAFVTSPLVRAMQTAEIAAAAFDTSDRIRVDERLAPGFDLDALAAILRDNSPAQGLVLVAHEPGMSEVIRDVTGGDVVLKKGGVAAMDLEMLDPPAGRLVWLVSPKLLEDAAGKRSE